MGAGCWKCILLLIGCGLKNTICTTTTADIPSFLDCEAIQKAGLGNGVHTIKPSDEFDAFDVYCQDGWMVIQRRSLRDVDFDKGWDSYADGFGDSSGDHWLGLKYLHIMSQSMPMRLRMDMEAYDSSTAFATYTMFSVGLVADGARLHLGGYTADSTAGDSLTRSDGSSSDVDNMLFSTKDRDQDNYPGNCAADIWSGGWWNNVCAPSPNTNKPFWISFRGLVPLSRFTMLVKLGKPELTTPNPTTVSTTKEQTTSPHLSSASDQTTSSQVSTSNDQSSSATTNVQTPFTSDQSTSTSEQATSTSSDQTTSISNQIASSSDQATSTSSDQNTSTSDQITSISDQIASTSSDQKATSDPTTSFSDQTATSQPTDTVPIDASTSFDLTPTTTTTTTITTSTSVPPPPTPNNAALSPPLFNPCGCRCVQQPAKTHANASSPQAEMTPAQQALAQEIAALRVETRNTSKSVRTKTSAVDQRASSRLGGYLALALLGIVASLIVLPDALIFFVALHDRLQKRKGRKVAVEE